jgi:hypothetical protein
MRGKKPTADDDVPWGVLILFRKGGLKLVTHLINSIDVTGEWPRILSK